VACGYLYFENKELIETNSALLDVINEAKLRSKQLKVEKTILTEKQHAHIALNISEHQCEPLGKKSNQSEQYVQVGDVEDYMFIIEEKINLAASHIRYKLENAQTENEIQTTLNTLVQLGRFNLNTIQVTKLLDTSKLFSEALRLKVLDFLEGNLGPEHATSLYPYIQSEQLSISKTAFERLKELDNTEVVLNMLDDLSFNAFHSEIQLKAVAYIQHVNQTTNSQN